MIILDEVTCTLSSGRLRTTVLQGASAILPTDTHMVILGQSGSGKSTLIKLLSGAILPNAGTITRYAQVSYPVGYTGGFKRTMTARENIAHAARIYGSDVDEVVDFVAAVTEMGHALDEVYGDLPSHLSRRMAYAVSYAIPFDVYLIDDRIAGGDPEFRERCEYMFEQRTKESSFILTTSVPRYAKKYGKKAAILHDGLIVVYDDLEKAVRDFERLERRQLGVRPRRVEPVGAEDAADNDED